MSAQVAVQSNPDLLAASVAARLVTRLVDAQAAGSIPSVVLTGGRIGISVLDHVQRAPARDAVDWRRVEFWWGDERFVPEADTGRNELQARQTLLDHVPVDPARVHPFPASDGQFGTDVDAAAEWYAGQLSDHARPEDHGPVPCFDVLLLGIGEEGHTASIFPESPAAYEERSVVAVRNCPKPPPTRLTLTFPALTSAHEVWMVAAGAGKARAVAMALGGVGRVQLPAAGARGRNRTLWLLDRAAAAKLPSSFLRLPVS
ncbi:MAG: 6-phosphogluconolactonase [Geodermatophilaceae bacterium]